MMKQDNSSLQNALNKEEVQQLFNKLFQDQSNMYCFQCGKKCKQWTDISHAIFLCLNCAAQYKQLKWAVSVKSITLDLWSKKQLDLLMIGGNKRFKQFLKFYELNQSDYKTKLKSKAAHHYKILINEQLNGRQPPEPPIKQVGRSLAKQQIPITDMSPQQIFEYTKEKALQFGTLTKKQAIWLGSKTKQYGSKAINKIQHKVSSGQLKQDAKKAAQSVKNTAKTLWNFAKSKIGSQKKQQSQNRQL